MAAFRYTRSGCLAGPPSVTDFPKSQSPPWAESRSRASGTPMSSVSATTAEATLIAKAAGRADRVASMRPAGVQSDWANCFSGGNLPTKEAKLEGVARKYRGEADMALAPAMPAGLLAISRGSTLDSPRGHQRRPMSCGVGSSCGNTSFGDIARLRPAGKETDGGAPPQLPSLPLHSLNQRDFAQGGVDGPSIVGKPSSKSGLPLSQSPRCVNRLIEVQRVSGFGFGRGLKL